MSARHGDASDERCVSGLKEYIPHSFSQSGIPDIFCFPPIVYRLDIPLSCFPPIVYRQYTFTKGGVRGAVLVSKGQG